MSEDDSSSKDRFFQQLAQISEEMIAAHGKDFAMGALVLAARFIAEGEARARVAAEAASQAATKGSEKAATKGSSSIIASA